MEKRRIMQFKLLSYKQALKKAQEQDDEHAIKSWVENIAELQNEIKQTV